MTLTLKTPLVVLFMLGITFLILHNIVRTTISSPLPVEKVVRFNPQWKEIALQLLEKVRNGVQLNEAERAILAQIYLSTKNGNYSAELEDTVQELLTLIEMIFDIHDQIVNDEGEHRGDRSPVPDGH